MKSYDEIRQRIDGFGPTISKIVSALRDAKRTADASAIGDVDNTLERLAAEMQSVSTAMVELGAGRDPQTLNGDGQPWQPNDGRDPAPAPSAAPPAVPTGQVNQQAAQQRGEHTNDAGKGTGKHGDDRRGAFFRADNGEHYLLASSENLPDASNDDLINAGVAKFHEAEKAAAGGKDKHEPLADGVLHSRIVIDWFNPSKPAVKKIEDFAFTDTVPATGAPPSPPRNNQAADKPVSTV